MAGCENHLLAGCMCTEVCTRRQRTSPSRVKGKEFNVYGKGQRLLHRVGEIRMSLMQTFAKGGISVLFLWEGIYC